ncbi:MAG: class I SAM-dependent RNA methyltransferase [Myxococcales bacterium]|nr:class I SAM-dependent RNA methyltransferase [Myxococcales bacterium]
MHELTIDSLGFGGDGVGRLGGKVVFVPRAAPGDRVRVRVLRERKGFINAELLEVLEPGAGRRTAPCALADRCGGCPWQHVAERAQGEAKRRIVADALRRVAPDVEVTMHAAPEGLGYRRRTRLALHGDRLGYRAASSRDLIDVARCPALAPALDAALESLRAVLCGRGVVGSLSLLAGRDAAGLERVHASLRVESGAAPRAQALCVGVVAGAVVEQRKRGDRERAGVERLDISLAAAEQSASDAAPLWCSAEAFSQANAAQDAALRALVAEHLSEARPRRLLELHAGIGNLTRLAAAAADEVIAVERSAAACELLRDNCAGLAVEARCDDALAACEALSAEGVAADVVLLDPPRSGCAELCEVIEALAPRYVVYVSCDPMTLARDIARLPRYAVTRVDALDMMPQTYHVETIASLALREARAR